MHHAAEVRCIQPGEKSPQPRQELAEWAAYMAEEVELEIAKMTLQLELAN